MTQQDVVFHAANAIDAYQTAELKDMCRTEILFPTRQVLGATPDSAETYLFFAVVSVIYQQLPAKVKRWFVLSKVQITRENSTLTSRCRS